MKVIRMDTLPQIVTQRGCAARALVDEPSVQVMNLLLKPGQDVPPHLTPVDVLLYVVEGRGTIQIGDESQEITARDMVFSPKNIPHGLAAADSPFNVLVIKMPNPKHNK